MWLLCNSTFHTSPPMWLKPNFIHIKITFQAIKKFNFIHIKITFQAIKKFNFIRIKITFQAIKKFNFICIKITFQAIKKFNFIHIKITFQAIKKFNFIRIKLTFQAIKKFTLGPWSWNVDYPLFTPACLPSVLWFVILFPTKQSFNDVSLSFEYIHPNRVTCSTNINSWTRDVFFGASQNQERKCFYTSSSKRAHAIQHALMHHSKYLMSECITMNP